MKIQLIRNATVKIFFGGKCFLIDPYFSEKHSQPSFAGRSLNPTVDLPMSTEEIISSVDYVLISHLHPDHFDERAKSTLPKNIPILCQPEDYETIKEFGFSNVRPINTSIHLDDCIIDRTHGEHGSGKIGMLMGNASGIVFQHPNEKTLHWAGDTVWSKPVQEAILDFNPAVIVCHAGGNRFFKEYPVLGEAFSEDSHPVIMDSEQVIELCYFALSSRVVATHLGSLDHETVTREELRNLSFANGVTSTQLLIPLDGESLEF